MSLATIKASYRHYCPERSLPVILNSKYFKTVVQVLVMFCTSSTNAFTQCTNCPIAIGIAIIIIIPGNTQKSGVCVHLGLILLCQLMEDSS